MRVAEQWWAYVPGASWRHPEGPGSVLDGRELHPVVHVAYRGCQRYAHWAQGKEPQTENGGMGVRRARRTRGSDLHLGKRPAPGGEVMANTWAGAFP